MDLESILSLVRSGQTIRPLELLPHLSVEQRGDRGRANYALAEAYAEAGDFHQAGIFISRAWVLSGFSPEVLPLYRKIYAALDDVEAIRGAYKRLGMVSAAAGRIADALYYFNLWQYAYTAHRSLDKYDYDFDILDCVDRLAAPYRFGGYDTQEPLRGRKVRLAYLLHGMADVNSVLVKINLLFARYHDKDHFDITFFLPEPKFILAKTHVRENIDRFRSCGWNVVTAPYELDDLNRLFSVAQQIHDYKPDVLIVSALLAKFEHYFVTSLRPAPLTIGLLQGPPQQFAAPNLDWCISWSKHPLIDSPCDATHILIGLDLPDRSALQPVERSALGIPGSARVLMSSGRYVKFSDQRLWTIVRDLLSEFPDLHYVVVGASREQLPFLGQILTEEHSQRVHLLGWRSDPLNLLCMADAVLDTYPSGGGHVLIDAMALGVPFVSFENNYMNNFDQTDWSVADEFVTLPELIVPRGDIAQCRMVAASLLADADYRSRMGNLCRDLIRKSMGSPEQSIRAFERQVLSVIDRKRDSAGRDGGGLAFRRSGALKVLGNLVARVRRHLNATG